jgi:flagellar motility protein MotE (MotC chaperone)
MKNIRFNEWLTQRGDNSGLKHSDETEMITSEDSELVDTQMSMFVDRIAGIMHNLSEEKRAAAFKKFVTELRTRLTN